MLSSPAIRIGIAFPPDGESTKMAVLASSPFGLGSHLINSLPTLAMAACLRSAGAPGRRSVVCVGNGKRGRIILDTLNRVMVYPLDEFADTDAFQRLRELLRQKIELLADSREQWAQMEERASVARPLSAAQQL